MNEKYTVGHVGWSPNYCSDHFQRNGNETDRIIKTLSKSYTKEEALDFILALDLSIAEEDFTIQLIRRLVESLLKDNPGWSAKEILGNII